MSSIIQQEQAKTIIAYSQNQFTNDVVSDETYRLRLPSEAKTFELKGIVKIGAFYAINDFKNILDTANEVAYHLVNDEPSSGVPQKRLIEHIKTNYRNNDLVTVLPVARIAIAGYAF